MGQATWMIYGAYGYTGRLIAREAKERGMAPILAGRKGNALAPLVSELGFEARSFSLDSADEAQEALGDVDVVLHCAGPFSQTSTPMLNACIQTQTHYLDITGEIAVFESIHDQSIRWKEAGIVVIPGVGFDVVPSDCLAALLKRELPDATHLRLAFSSVGGRLSPGTTKTMLEGLREGNSMVRRNGILTSIPAGSLVDEIPFAGGAAQAVAIPWGDVSTAFYSTGIPNIEVYMAASDKEIRQMRMAARMTWFLKLPGVVPFLQKQIGKRVKGPNDAQRASGESRLWGEARNDAGRRVVMTMRTPEGYTHTVHASLGAVAHLLEHQLEPGAYTPSMAFGADYVLGLPGVEVHHVE